uniref:Zgc:174935 n=1 Tax=Mastacembelus armatus TaxID=205130 RepID=A0A3Q3MF97_9TELE
FKSPLLVPLIVLVSFALLATMNVRKKEQEKEDRQNKFQDIKLRVTYDVLRETEDEKAETQNLLEKTQREQKALEEKVHILHSEADKKKGEVDICQGGQDCLTNDITRWRTEEETLKKQLAARSVVCDFVKTGSQEASKLCVNEVPKEEDPKAEVLKKEGPKAEAPKQEESKVDAPKQEEPKAEAPKQEEPKAEAPKQEEPKAEAPKQEEPKVEAPKQEEPKVDAPKQEEPKVDAPKQEEPKKEASKQEEPKEEPPKKDKPKAEGGP